MSATQAMPESGPRPEAQTDVLILGGGPGGCAAALTCRRAGLRVLLLEAARFPRRRPGETLHPGVEAVFAQLGVRERVEAAGFTRHRGSWVAWEGAPVFQEYGADAAGPWLGYQAERARLDALLLAAAVAAGVEVGQPEKVEGLLRDGGRVTGAITNRRTVRAAWTIDAAGGQHWLARELGLGIEAHGPPMTARFGWRRTGPNDQEAPQLEARADGWEWAAPLNAERVATCRLVMGGQGEARRTSAASRPGVGDVTWRLVRACAGPGYFLVGDAAAVVDPLSSHGVLRGLLSGSYAGQQAAAMQQRRRPQNLALAEYLHFTSEFFRHDTEALRQIYARHPSHPPMPGHEELGNYGEPK